MKQARRSTSTSRESRHDPISWKDGVLTNLVATDNLRWFNTQALAVNGSGDIVGTGYVPDVDNASHAAFFSNGQGIILDQLVRNLGRWQLQKAVDISNDGIIVGIGLAPVATLHSFMLVPQ